MYTEYAAHPSLYKTFLGHEGSDKHFELMWIDLEDSILLTPTYVTHTLKV